MRLGAARPREQPYGEHAEPGRTRVASDRGARPKSSEPKAPDVYNDGDPRLAEAAVRSVANGELLDTVVQDVARIQVAAAV